MKTHLSISQAGLVAILTQIVSFVAGFGIIDSTKAGLVIAAATAAVNAAFLVANAIHALAHAQVLAAAPPVLPVHPVA